MHNATKRTDIFLIDPRAIVVMEGFNVRRDFDLDELTEQIKAKGVLNPITVIPFKKDGVEYYHLVDGERRYRATMAAIKAGADIQYIKALKAPKGATMEDLCIEQMMRNEGKRFTEYEYAIMFKRFKDEYGYIQKDIADKFKKSPAFVSKCLSLLEMPPYIQKKIMKGDLSVKAAKEITNSYDGENEQIKAAKEVVMIAKEQGKATATSRELTDTLKAEKEAQEMAGILKKIMDHVGGTVLDVDRLTALLYRTGSLEKAAREYHKK